MGITESPPDRAERHRGLQAAPEVLCESCKDIESLQGAHSVGDGGEGTHVVLGQLKVQGFQVGLDVLRAHSLESGAHASLQLPAQQHLRALKSQSHDMRAGEDGLLLLRPVAPQSRHEGALDDPPQHPRALACSIHDMMCSRLQVWCETQCASSAMVFEGANNTLKSG